MLDYQHPQGLEERKLSRDGFSFWSYCMDYSVVSYIIEDGVKMVYHYRDDGTRWKAEYERGGWINF